MPYIGTQPTKVVSRQSANVYRYEATAGQTAFTGADLDNNVLACNPADMIVHMNGLRLESTDYTATSTTVTLTTAATAGDEVTITSFATFEVANTYDKTTADTRYVNTTGDTMTGGLVVQKSDAAVYNAIQMDNTYAAGATSGAAISWQQSGNVKSSIQANTYGNDYMSFHVNNNTERMRIDSAGRVTMPYQPAAAYTGYTSTSATQTLPSDNLFLNRGGHLNSSNLRFTCPVAGLYRVTINGHTDYSSAYNWIGVQKSGAWIGNNTLHWNKAGTNMHIHVAFNVLVDCAVNDYLEAKQSNANGVATDFLDRYYVTFELVG